ncbi:hypothetical protein [Deinococcus peraridilitoris]|uniref:Uncharacterized protein n=1 Tax=Deinococcus peraridilitoris (strain DSM 19664 / LMG 22246 / CIP 109416 / KR-200) TaxID=937777 RepID=L0A428_DEIPD|nr:hypothetical protein [Deinococcus peraridilitoris]AFZ68179.1 hypothetical protein Deipe_2714 [Deinococcus peraridilitoris DSM 19664]
MDFATLHPENKALNLLESAITLFPDFGPELRGWVQQLIGTIARPVPVPPSIEKLGEAPGNGAALMEHETFLLARALCIYRERVYPGGVASPQDFGGAARDDLESAMSRFEERLARSKPKVELENAPDTGDYVDGEDPDASRA